MLNAKNDLTMLLLLRNKLTIILQRITREKKIFLIIHCAKMQFATLLLHHLKQCCSNSHLIEEQIYNKIEDIRRTTIR